MEERMKRATGLAGIAAAVLFSVAVAGFGVALEGYSQAQYPVALLGAKAIPNALAFNLLAYVLPGALAAIVALKLRLRLPANAGWGLRMGSQFVLLSALAFIAMGLLPLDPGDLESDASRWHGTAWMAWCVAFVSGAALIGISLLRQLPRISFAWISLLAAAGVLVAAFVLPDTVPSGIAQRIAFAAWFVWFAIAGRRARH